MKLEMTRFSNALALAAPGAILLASQVTSSAFDVFLKIDGIEGESNDTYHKGQIDLTSWSWGMSQSSTTAGGGAGKVSVKDFSFTKYVDKSSPALFLKCATAQPIPTLTFQFTRPEAPGQNYYEVTLHDVLVTSIRSDRPQPTAGTTNGGLPTETVSLNFTKITMEYRPLLDATTGTLGETVSATADVEVADP